MDLVLNPMDSYQVAGGGTVYTMPAPYEMSRQSPEIRGKTVTIAWRGASNSFLVIGVERYASGLPKIKLGEHIGLLVRPVEDDTVTPSLVC